MRNCPRHPPRHRLRRASDKSSSTRASFPKPTAVRERGDAVSTNVALRVWRGDAGRGELTEYEVLANEGEVVLDILHRLQATQAGDLAVRWNCKAGKCG